ncbi:uncharacterized protein LOC144100721 [Amblyomma americanum]
MEVTSEQRAEASETTDTSGPSETKGNTESVDDAVLSSESRGVSKECSRTTDKNHALSSPPEHPIKMTAPQSAPLGKRPGGSSFLSTAGAGATRRVPGQATARDVPLDSHLLRCKGIGASLASVLSDGAARRRTIFGLSPATYAAVSAIIIALVTVVTYALVVSGAKRLPSGSMIGARAVNFTNASVPAFSFV